MTQLLIKLHQPYAYGYLEAAALATVHLVADAGGRIPKEWWEREQSVTISGDDPKSGEYTTFDLPQAGYYSIDITRPRGSNISRQVFVSDNEPRTELIELAVSPHEYLGWQQYAGIVRANPYRKETAALPPVPRGAVGGWQHTLKLSGDRLDALYSRVASIPHLKGVTIARSREAWLIANDSSPIFSGFETPNWQRNTDDQFAAWFQGAPAVVEGNQLVKQLRDPASPDFDGLAQCFPRWLAVESDGRTDLASLPWAWWGGHREKFDSVRLLYDRVRPSPVDVQAPGRFTITLQDRQWTGILEFLGSGKLDRADAMLDRALSAEDRGELYDPLRALHGKTKGPLVAVAGAIILVTQAENTPQDWDPWLDNLTNWFPGIPDGPIILGYRRVAQATSRAALVAAYSYLRLGIERGIPFFSASVRLLSAALARLASDLPSADDDRDFIGPLAARVDPDQPFTVIRLPNANK